MGAWCGKPLRVARKCCAGIREVSKGAKVAYGGNLHVCDEIWQIDIITIRRS